jgi:hypothetical protein
LQEQEIRFGKNILIKITIPKDHVRNLADELEREEIDFFRLFPDATGLGMALAAENRNSMQFYLKDRS